MGSFWDSVKLMLFIYALAAAVAYFVAWVMKIIFFVIQKTHARAEARNAAVAEGPLEPGAAAPERTD